MDVKAITIPVKLLSEGHCDEHNIYKGIRCMNCEIWICGMCGVLNHKQCRTLLVKEAYKEIQEQIALSFEKEQEERNARTDKITDSLKVLDVKRKELIEELKNCEKQIEELESLKLKEENLYKNVNLVKEIIESSSTYEEFSNAKKDIDSLRGIGKQHNSIELQRNQLDSNTKKIAEDSTSRISTDLTDKIVIDDPLEVSVDSEFRAHSIQIKLEDNEPDELMKIEIEECQFGGKKVSNVSNTSNSNSDCVLDEEIIRFLTDNGFLEYIDTFIENRIDFSVLSIITEEQIKNVIPIFGDRIRFCSKLSRYLTEKGVRQSPLCMCRSVSADATLLESHDDSMESSRISSSSSPSLPTYNLTESKDSFLPTVFSTLALSLLNGESMSSFRSKRAKNQLVREIQLHLDEKQLIKGSSTMINRSLYCRLGDEILRKYPHFSWLSKIDCSASPRGCHPCQGLLTCVSGRRRSARYHKKKLFINKTYNDASPTESLKQFEELLVSGIYNSNILKILRNSFSLRKSLTIEKLPFYLQAKDSLLCEIGLRMDLNPQTMLKNLRNLEEKYRIVTKESDATLADIELYLKSPKSERFLRLTNDGRSNVNEKRPGPCVMYDEEGESVFLYSFYDEKYMLLSGNFNIYEACLAGFGSYFLINREYPAIFGQFLSLLEISLKATNRAFPVVLRGKKLKSLLGLLAQIE